MPSFSPFGYTKCSEKNENTLFHPVSSKNKNEEFYRFYMKWVQTYHRMDSFLYVILILMKADLKIIILVLVCFFKLR